MANADLIGTRSELSSSQEILRAIWARKLLVVAIVAVATITALVLSLAQSKQYTATATLLFDDQTRSLLNPPGADQSVDPNRQAATNKGLVELKGVAVDTSRALRGRLSPSQVANAVEVSSGQSNLVNVKATTSSPTVSATVANTYANAFLTGRRTAVQRQIDEAIALVRASIDALTPTQAASAQGLALQARLNDLTLARAAQTVGAQLVQPATRPSSPSAPHVVRNTVLAGLLGLSIALAIAVLLARVDRRLRDADEIAEVYDFPLLGAIPRSRAVSQGEAVRDGAALPEAEAFRALRANLRYFDLGHDTRAIVVVSAMAGDGKSTVARNLATTMASMGDNVVLVEADLHAKRASPLPPGARGRGLSQVLVGADPETALVRVPLDGDGEGSGRAVTVLAAGPAPPNPSELLERPRMREVMQQLEERFDVVIIDTPALSAVSDALPLVAGDAGVLIVCGVGLTTRNAARQLTRRLALVDARVLGVVANFVSGPGARVYGYAYGYADKRPSRR